VTLTIDLLTPKHVGFHDSWWNISVSSLMILAASVYEISCRKIDRQTLVKTVPPPTTAVSVDW